MTVRLFRAFLLSSAGLPSRPFLVERMITTARRADGSINAAAAWALVDEVDGLRLERGWEAYRLGHQAGLEKAAPCQRRRLFEPTVVRLNSSGTFCLMNHPAKGWSSSAIEYRTLNDLLEEWDVRLGPHGADDCSPFIEAHPTPKRAPEVG